MLVVPGGRGQLGALTLGAAGLLRGRHATTHWNSFHLLSHFGAIPRDERVVIDGNLISTAGVSAGIDGSLRLYAPEPPFPAGNPSQAPPQVLASAREQVAALTAARLAASQK